MNFVIKDRLIGDGAPCCIVAEIGLNHNGDSGLARTILEQAALAGADAVKLQTINAEELYGPSHPRFDICRRLQLTENDYKSLARRAEELKVIFFSTPFDERSADFLDDLGVPLFKIGSGDLTHHALLRHVARKGKPIVVSTGMASMDQIDRARQVILDAGNEQVILLHCVSIYPAPVEKANVRAVQTLRRTFNTLVGLSDHTLSAAPAVAAVALGACMIEKHFTVSRALPEGDNDISLEPAELKRLVQDIRDVEASLGTGCRTVLPEEEPLIPKVRRGIYARVAIRRGERISGANIAVRRPVDEIPAEQIDHLLGRRATVEIPAGAAIRWEQISG